MKTMRTVTHILILCALSFQVPSSIAWMHRNASILSYHQQVRREAGEWLNQNVKPGECVLSGDIGMIAYTAKDVQFVDILGLTSKDVLSVYKRGGSLDEVIAKRKPKYIANTFNIQDGQIVYKPVDDTIIRGIRPSHMPPMRLLWAKQIGPELAIAIAEMR